MSRPCDEYDLSADTPEWAWPEGAVGQPDILPYRLEEQIKKLCFGSVESVGSISFLALPDPDSLVRGTDPDPSIIKQK
jgi:hypothetical protein